MGMGLVKDAQILQLTLARLGYDVRVEAVISEVSYSPLLRWLLDFSRKINFIAIYKKIGKLLHLRSSVYAIHLENIIYKKCFLNQNHILIPNQEWFEPRNQGLLTIMQAVWCKTHYAENIFRELGARVTYIGFASQINPTCLGLPKHKNYFFSRIGKSRHRGTELLVDVWRRHPEWPTLKMVIHKERFPSSYPANVECIESLGNDEDYHLLASSSLLHVCMTETEGFGHSIVEAMGYGCVLLVTDAPPMNEIASAECALMVPSAYSGQKSFSPRFAAIPAALEANVMRVLQMTDIDLGLLSTAAEERYQKLRDEFEKRLKDVISRMNDSSI